MDKKTKQMIGFVGLFGSLFALGIWFVASMIAQNDQVLKAEVKTEINDARDNTYCNIFPMSSSYRNKLGVLINEPVYLLKCPGTKGVMVTFNHVELQ